MNIHIYMLELVVDFTSHLGLSVEDLVILTKSVDIFKLDLCLFDINCRQLVFSPFLFFGGNQIACLANLSSH